MDQNGNKMWPNSAVDTWESTEAGISVSAVEEEVPSLPVAAVVGVTLVVIIAIVIVFVLGIFIDCRQQRIIAQKMGQAKRPKSSRKASTHPDGDHATIVDNMEQPDLVAAPAEFVRSIP